MLRNVKDLRGYAIRTIDGVMKQSLNMQLGMISLGRLGSTIMQRLLPRP